VLAVVFVEMFMHELDRVHSLLNFLA